jgi:hypothetical protein
MHSGSKANNTSKAVDPIVRIQTELTKLVRARCLDDLICCSQYVAQVSWQEYMRRCGTVL